MFYAQWHRPQGQGRSAKASETVTGKERNIYTYNIMKNSNHYAGALALAALLCMPCGAQSLRLKGIGHNNRYDDGDQMKSTYVGWNSELGKAIFIVDNGIYGMTWDGTTLGTPEKEPPVDAAEVRADADRQLWATNFNMMYGNSGAVYVDGQLVTVMSRDEQSTTDEELFAVRKWDARTGELLSSENRPKSDCLESAGMCYNPKDGKVYGLFYLTGQDLPEEVTSDPDYFEDEDADMTDGDAGYCLCTIDLGTMKVTPITPGLYYYNFVTFAINSEGRAFALTSGGSSGYTDEDGKLRNTDGNLAGAQLCEIDLATGLMKTKPHTYVDDGETQTEQVNIYDQGTGYSSQYSRQAACFAKGNPGKMYWVGYINSGKGINEGGSWTSLSDKEWRTNGKYDTALYEVDIETGEATMLSKVTNRWVFSALWVDGDDASDGAGIDVSTPDPATTAFIALSTTDNGAIWQQAEQGQQYTYRLEPAIGWKVHSVTFNNQDITSQVTETGTITTPVISSKHNTLFVTFEQANTAVRGVEERDSQVRILGREGGISVRNARPGDMLLVYTADGRLLHSRRLDASQTDVPLDAMRLYIVKVAGKVVKVRL